MTSTEMILMTGYGRIGELVTEKRAELGKIQTTRQSAA